MNLAESKGLAWGALVIVVFLIILTVSLRIVNEVWEYSSLFCAFMTVFCHLMALNLRKMSLAASRKLDVIALVFGILTVIAIIVIFILGQVN